MPQLCGNYFYPTERRKYMINKRKCLLGSAAVLFIAFEVLMFYLIHIEKAELGFNLHYACIIAAAAFSWLTLIIELATAKDNGESVSEILLSKSRGNLIRIAMLFTLLADYFLVAAKKTDNLAGVTVFLGTQLFIFLHILANEDSKKAAMANIIIRAALTAVIIAVALIILGEDADTLAIISVIYYANLCTNAIFAHRIGRGGVVLTIGLILFALCDINVGLSALNSLYVDGFPEGSFLYKLMNSDMDLIWIFYIPSQTLIPLTLLLRDEK